MTIGDEVQCTTVALGSFLLLLHSGCIRGVTGEALAAAAAAAAAEASGLHGNAGILQASVFVFLSLTIGIVLLVCCLFHRKRNYPVEQGNRNAQIDFEMNGRKSADNRTGQSYEEYREVPTLAVINESRNAVHTNGPSKIVSEQSGPDVGQSGLHVGQPMAGGNGDHSRMNVRQGSLPSMLGNEDLETVTFVGDKSDGLGFTIDGNSADGIFVRNVLPSGPAGQYGNLHYGDRIMSLAISMENMSVIDAQSLIDLANRYPTELHIKKRSSDIAFRSSPSETPKGTSGDVAAELEAVPSVGLRTVEDDDDEEEEALGGKKKKVPTATLR